MAGAIDIKSGSNSLSGANLFYADKNPLNQLFQGVDDVLGHQAHSAGQAFLDYVHQIVQELIKAIVGLPSEILQGVLSTIAPLLQDVSTYFGNIEKFLGGLNPLSALFDVATAAEQFVNNVLSGTGLLTDAQQVYTFLSNLFAQVNIAANDFISAATHLLKTIVDNLFHADLRNAVINFVQSVLNPIPGGGGGPLPSLGVFGNAVVSFAEDGTATIVAGINDLGQGIAKVAETGLSDTQHLFNQIGIAFGQDVSQGLDAAEQFFSSIPSGNVLAQLASGAGANIGDAVQQTIDAGANALAGSGFSLSNQAFSQISNYGNTLLSYLGFSPAAPNSQPGGLSEVALTGQTFLNQRATTKPPSLNVDPSLDAVFHLTDVKTSTTLPLTTVSPGTSVVGFITTPDAGVKNDIAWLGYPTTLANITGVYVNVYQMSNVQTISLGNPTGGTYTLSFAGYTTALLQWSDTAATVAAALAALTKINAPDVSVTGSSSTSFTVTLTGALSGNPSPANGGLAITINSSLTGGTSTSVTNSAGQMSFLQGGVLTTTLPSTSSPQWYYLPLATPISTAQGNIYAVEFAITGTSTYNLVGVSNYLPSHPTVLPAKYGATRTMSPSVTFDNSGPGYTLNNAAGTATSVSTSWTHTVLTSSFSTAVIVAVQVFYNGLSGEALSGSVTYNGTAMTLLGSYLFGNNGVGFAYYGINGVSGSGTVNVNIGLGTTAYIVRANSFSYLNVASFGTPVGNLALTNTPTTSASSASITSATGQRVFQMFALYTASSTTSTSNYSGTVRESEKITNTATAGTEAGTTYYVNVTMGDAAGASTVTFTETISNPAAGSYTSYAVPLLPLNYSAASSPSSAPGQSGSSFAYSNTTPWFGLSGTAATISYPPELVGYGSAGIQPNFSIPTWANHVDIVVISGGGGGGYTGSYYEGGTAGIWNYKTISRSGTSSGNNIVVSPFPTTLSVTVGNGGGFGSGGGYSSVTGTGFSSISSTPGVAGGNSVGQGAGAGNIVYNGTTYYGGPASGGTGNAPGGGGDAGNFGGAPGAVFLLAYQ